MIREAIDKILSLAEPHIEEINGRTYTDRTLTPINGELRADHIQLNTLSSLIDYICIGANERKPSVNYFVQVVSPIEVRLLSGLDSDRKREVLATVIAEVPRFNFGSFVANEEFIIGVQSKFCDGDNDKSIILQFAGNVKAGTVAEYGDTGVGQKATIKRGVASVQEVEVPSPCSLVPYRTFSEIQQPKSNFIFRVKDEERYGVTCALFEADGGAWKIDAQKKIKEFLKARLEGVDDVFVIQ